MSTRPLPIGSAGGLMAGSYDLLWEKECAAECIYAGGRGSIAGYYGGLYAEIGHCGDAFFGKKGNVGIRSVAIRGVGVIAII